MVFLPQHPEARAIAKRTWACDPCKLTPRAKADAMSEVATLFEGDPVMRKTVTAMTSAEKAKRALSPRLKKKVEGDDEDEAPSASTVLPALR